MPSKLKLVVPMKKIIPFLVLSIVFSSQLAHADNNPESRLNNSFKLVKSAPGYTKKITQGGTYLHLGLMVPSKNYMWPKDTVNPTNDRFNLGFGLEIGELFQLSEGKGDVSFGLRFTIINALYTSYVINGKTVSHMLQGSAFDLGPCLSIGLDKQNAIDLYYQLCPTYVWDTQDSSSFGASGAFGINHTFGLGYRFKVLSIGGVYNLGNAKYIDAPNKDSFYKRRLDHFRFYIGFMF